MPGVVLVVENVAITFGLYAESFQYSVTDVAFYKYHTLMIIAKRSA